MIRIKIILLLLFLSPIALAVRPKHLTPQIQHYQVRVEAKTHREFIAEALASTNSPNLIVINQNLFEDLRTLNTDSSKTYLQSAIIETLDRQADFMMAQLPMSVQIPIRNAYYYNLGLNQHPTLRMTRFKGHLPFGFSEPSNNSFGFRTNWPAYLTRAPILERILKLELLVIGLGQRLTVFQEKDTFMDSYVHYERNKQPLEFKILVQQYYLHSSLLRIMGSDELRLDIADLKNEALSGSDKEAISQYVESFDVPQNMLTQRFFGYVKLLMAINKTQAPSSMKFIDNFIGHIMESIDYQAMAIDKIGLLPKNVQMLSMELENQITTQGHPEFQKLELASKLEQAQAMNDQLGLNALKNISKAMKSPFYQCMSLLLH